MRPAWLPLATVTFTALVAATLVGALAGIADQVLPQAATARLTRSPQASVTVIGVGDSSTVRSDTRAVRRSLDGALRDVPYQLETAVWSGPLAVDGGTGGTAQPAEIASPTRISAHAALVTGAWPGPAPSGGSIPAALPQPMADRLGVTPGELLQLSDLNSGAALILRVSGTYRQRDPASSYWTLDQIWTCGATIRNCPAAHGPIVVSPASFGRNALTVAQASWVALPEADRIATGELNGLAGRIDQAQSVLQQPSVGLVVTTGMPALLRGTATDLAVARSVAAVAAAELLVPAVAALALAGGLLASHREQEAALLTARGADRRQQANLALLEGVPIGAAAAAVGAFAGVTVADVLAGAGSAGGAGLQARAPTAPVWLAALGVVVVCALVMLWAALRGYTARGARVGPSGRGTQATLVRAGADVALLALAAIAVWQLRVSSVSVTSSGGLGLDPVLIAAPTLALAAISVLLLRAVPVTARLADRVSARARGIGTALAAWELGRRPVRQAGPVVLTVFTVAAGTLALAQYSSWQRSAHDQAAFATGAEVRVDEPAAIPLDTVAAVTRARGVIAATPVSVVDAGSNGELLAVGAETAPTTVLLRRDLSALPAAELWRRIAPGGRRPGLVLPGRPARLELVAGLDPGPGAGLGTASATMSIQDGTGAVYSVPAGSLPGDGHAHGLIGVLSTSGRAEYPLRLLGLTLDYQLPPAPLTSQAPARLTIESMAVAPPGGGAFTTPFAKGGSLAGWRPAAYSADLTNLGVPASVSGSPLTGSQPVAGTWRAEGVGPQVLTFQPGYAPVPATSAQEGGPPPALGGTVSVTAPAPAVIPAIATQTFAGNTGAGLGQTVAVQLGTDTLRLRVAAVVTAFPTVTAAGGGLVVDQAVLQEVLVNRHDAPLPVTSWWLRTASGAVPPGLPSGSAVSTQAGQAATLLADPLSATQQQMLRVVAAAMVLLAVVGFATKVAVDLRAGRARRALLGALGVAPAAHARLLALDQLLLSLPAACAGLLAGTGVAYLLIPSITLTANGTPPVPPLVVVFAFGWEIVLAAVVAAAPLVVVAAGAMWGTRGAGNLRGLAAS